MIQYLGYAAGAMTVLSFLPQTTKAWRSHDTSALSLRMLGLLLAAGALWITYGVLTKDWPVIATNAGTVTLNAVLLAAKLRFK